MLKYILKRLLMLLPVLLGISLLIFAIMSLTPGDPARLVLGSYATEDDLAEWREERGLNDPFFYRYFDYIFKAIRGEFGTSYVTNNNVLEELSYRIPTTLELTAGAMLLMIFIGVPVGIISAVKQYKAIDYISMILALILTSIPAFWLGLILMLKFSLQLDWLPATGSDTWKHFILPSITLSAALMASLLRMTRSNMLEVIRQDYIRTARSKGANERTIIFKHALRNALLPVITIIGLNFGTMMGGALITETVFGIAGVGTLLVTAVRMKDTPQVMICILFIACTIGLINLCIDIIYMFVDPRLKTQFLKGKR